LKRKRSASSESNNSNDEIENIDQQIENSTDTAMFWDFRKNLLNLDKIKTKEIPIKNCKHFV